VTNEARLKQILGVFLLVIGMVFFFIRFDIGLLGVVIIAVGIALLVAIRRANEEVGKKQDLWGVFVVGTLTLIASFFLGFLSMVSYVGYFGGGADRLYIEIVLSAFDWFVVLSPAFLGLFGFFAAIVLLLGYSPKGLWVLMNVYWLVLFFYFVWWGYWKVSGWLIYWAVWSYPCAIDILLPLFCALFPIIYSLICLACFQRKRVRQYFNMARTSIIEPYRRTETRPEGVD
jgi:hypothetical protein